MINAVSLRGIIKCGVGAGFKPALFAIIQKDSGRVWDPPLR